MNEAGSLLSHGRADPAYLMEIRGMIFTLLFLMWTCVLAAAWLAPRAVAFAAFGVAFLLSVALFVHHVTDPLTLSF
jgi:hypothetical protein